MDKSEDLSKKYEISKNERKIVVMKLTTKHTHIQMGNSDWHLRVCHCPLTQHSFLTPLGKPNNIEQCKFETNDTQFILGI